jgi:probable F420-dependent oxidoreductase
MTTTNTAVGLCLPQLGEHVTRGAVQAFCRRAEELGYAGLWAQEHLYFPRNPSSGYAARPGVPVPEQYRTTMATTELLAAAAAWTDRIGIGSSVFVGGYHRPVELAQRTATLDVLSDGRLTVGFSVGWSQEEHEQMGVDFHTRGRWLDELVAALVACWGPDPVNFEGEFFSILDADVRPKPLQSPGPKLLSGMRSAPGLRRTAALFDIWNPASGSASEITATCRELASMRDPALAPLEVYERVYVEPPVRRPGLDLLGVEGVTAAVADAREAGFAQVIIDANFWHEIRSPSDWAGLPDLLLPALRAGSEGAALLQEHAGHDLLSAQGG